MTKVSTLLIQVLSAVFIFVCVASARTIPCGYCERNLDKDPDRLTLVLPEPDVASVPTFSGEFQSEDFEDDWVDSPFPENSRLPHFGWEKRHHFGRTRPIAFWGHKDPRIGTEEGTQRRDAGTQDDPPSIPEPETLVLLATGLIGLAGGVRYRMARWPFFSPHN